MSNLHFQKPQKKKPSAGKGFYIALAACLLAVGTASWATFDSLANLTQEAPSSQTPSSEDFLLVSSRPESSSKAPASSRQSSSSKPSSNKPDAVSSKAPAISSSKAPASSETAKPAAAAPTTFIMPTTGKVIKDFSDGESVYSLTFGDWRIHEGVDLSAAKGSTVKAIANGVVKEITQDDMMGTIVVIEHDGGLTASYCGLEEKTPVAEGETIKAGQVIGSVAEIPSEIVDESHIHLEIVKDGKTVDPLEIMGKEKEKLNQEGSSTPSEKE